MFAFIFLEIIIYNLDISYIIIVIFIIVCFILYEQFTLIL